MRIVEIFSHLNGEEYILVHHKTEYLEIKEVIASVDATKLKTKISKEIGNKKGKLIWNPGAINKEFARLFQAKGWNSMRRDFYVSYKPHIARILEPLSLKEQKKYLDSIGEEKLFSYNQTDFLKNKIAIEVQFGKYFAVTYDLFVKHLSFYTGNLINVGIEIIPMKSMQREMSSGPPWFEKEVHNVLRHGRTNPPVPLLIIGIAP